MDNLNIGTWIRFYTNTTRPNITHTGRIYKLWTIKIEHEDKIIGYWVENAVMKYQISQRNVVEVLKV